MHLRSSTIYPHFFSAPSAFSAVKLHFMLETLSPETTSRLHELIDELLRVNQQFNLTAIRDADEAWVKHIVDSLQGLQSGLFEGRKSFIDVGAGAGFPGLPLVIAQPDLRPTFLEATRKKCDFIKATTEMFGIDAKVQHARAEELGQSVVWRERFDIATARAVGSLSEVCELCLPLVKVGGHALLWRGSEAEAETKKSRGAIAQLGGAVKVLSPYQLPGHGPTYHLVTIAKNKHTPPAFPRRAGLPKQKPL